MLVIAVIAAAVTGYTQHYYHADRTALDALGSDRDVRITQTGYGWLFDGPSEEHALIFYPGGKVDERAYAPLLHQLASDGPDVCLVKMPARLAVLGMDRADDVMKSCSYAHWYIGGHSLGGAAATHYAAEHADALDGVILLGAYAMDPLPEDLETVVIYGSEDRVLDMEKYHEKRPNLPRQAVEHIIAGGNHAQFGSYGTQRGDGTAKITPQEQRDETIDTIAKAGLCQEEVPGGAGR